MKVDDFDTAGAEDLWAIVKDPGTQGERCGSPRRVLAELTTLSHAFAVPMKRMMPPFRATAGLPWLRV